MGWRLRRSVRLMPGLRLNLGLSGLSLSAGPRGASVNIGPRGVFRNIGLPGTGLSHRSRIGPPVTRPTASYEQHTVSLDLDHQGRLVIHAADGQQLEQGLERRIRRERASELLEWLRKRCEEIEAGFGAIATVHLDTPAPRDRASYVPAPFGQTEPSAPEPPRFGFWDRIVPGRKRAREARHAADQEQFQAAHRAWEAAREEHRAVQERERVRVEEQLLKDTTVMSEELERALAARTWPRETLVHFAIEDGGTVLLLDVDLPEFEDMPTQAATVASRGLKLNIHERSATQLRHAYAAHVHGVVFRLVGIAFGTLPALREVVCSGFSQRRDPRTAHEQDDYLLSVRVSREQWSTIDFRALSHLDPVACLERFELVRELSASGQFHPIRPLAELPKRPDGHDQPSPESTSGGHP